VPAFTTARERRRAALSRAGRERAFGRLAADDGARAKLRRDRACRRSLRPAGHGDYAVTATGESRLETREEARLTVTRRGCPSRAASWARGNRECDGPRRAAARPAPSTRVATPPVVRARRRSVDGRRLGADVRDQVTALGSSRQGVTNRRDVVSFNQEPAICSHQQGWRGELSPDARRRPRFGRRKRRELGRKPQPPDTSRPFAILPQRGPQDSTAPLSDASPPSR